MIDDLAVADDHLLDLRAQFLERRDEFSNAAVVGHRISSPWMTSPGPSNPGDIISCKRYAKPRPRRCGPQARLGVRIGWPRSAVLRRRCPSREWAWSCLA